MQFSSSHPPRKQSMLTNAMGQAMFRGWMNCKGSNDVSGRRAMAIIAKPGEQRSRRVRWHERRDAHGRLAARAALAMRRLADHAGEAARDRVGFAQVGVSEHHDRRAV